MIVGSIPTLPSEGPMTVILEQSEVINAIADYLDKRGIKAGHTSFKTAVDGKGNLSLITTVKVDDIKVHQEGPYR